MKTIFAIFTLAVLSTLSACSTTPGSASDAEPRQINMDQLDRKRVQLFIESDTGLPFTGQMVERYRGGSLRRTVDVVEGVPTGLVTEYFESGQKKEEVEIINGKPTIGTATEWFENGEKHKQAKLVDGRPTQETEWYETGQMKSMLTYENGRPQQKRTWDENGVETTAGRESAGASGSSSRTGPVLDSGPVAVMPFINMSQDAEGETLADEFTEAIIHTLDTRSASVIASSESSRYKNTNTDIRQIGEELGAKYIVEGSIRHAGDRVRITAQLIRTDDGYHIWSETFDRSAVELTTIQQTIGDAVTGALSSE